MITLRNISPNCFVFIIIAFLLSLSMPGVTYGQNLDVDEPRTVRLIYFLPNDRSFRRDVIRRMKNDIRVVQHFYADQMQAHGYGRKTFQFETNAKGIAKVHRVNGKHPFDYYDNTLGYAVVRELEQTFDFSANLYFVVLGAESLRNRKGKIVGGAGFGRGKIGGYIIAPNGYRLFTIAHELGHAFGLSHDFRDDSYIMSYGDRRKPVLSTCAAEYLSISPFFNPNIPTTEGSAPTIELISALRYSAGSEIVKIRLKVKDPNGVHQVLLSSYSALQACRGLGGKREAIVEFEYTGAIGHLDFDKGHIGLARISDAPAHEIVFFTVNKDFNRSGHPVILAEESKNNIFTLKAHTDHIISLAFSPDGKTLASASFDHTVKLWNIARKKNIATLEHTRRVKTVAFSPDGKMLASGGNDGIKLWDVANKSNIKDLWHGDFVTGLAFSPDGKILLSGGDDWTLKLWDVATKRNIKTLETGDFVKFVAFSSDGKTFASSGWKNGVQLWDMARKRNIKTFDFADAQSVAFSPDGKMLASGSLWDEVKLWNVSTKDTIFTSTKPPNVPAWYCSVAFSPNSKILVSSDFSGRVKLWDTTTGSEISILQHTSPVVAVAFSPNGKILATGTFDGTIEFWKRPTKALAKFRKNPAAPSITAMIPNENALHANYPNPFNPETWIPYQLSKSADVTLTIYAANGQVVRRLALEHQPAGMYQNRSRAAYWDGRNTVGEPVASGIYFYTLRADDFTATRKMFILK